MKLGAFDIHPLSDGRFRLDGGAMFGVVPKVLWEKCCPVDDLNRIPLSLTTLLIRAHGKNILVDTGLGAKEDGKFHRMFAVEREPTLMDSLKRHGLDAQDIHLVINTHLHFDHAGGNTRRDRQGRLRPAFPNARYIVQHDEFQDAACANERTRASYRQDDFGPISNQWEFLHGDTELLPGLTAVVTAGHTRCHQGVKIESEGRVAFFLGDLIPTVSHLPLPYIMGYDLFPVQTLETKRWILDRAFEERWLLLFEHDPLVQAGYVRRDQEGKYFLREVTAWQ
ncbi:MBL fold metallo-hydrolase [Nitrospira sp. KM1]|uniref:MBL fold metallo-hydrolase n=1 Tax=Nitrospira sp. KM1 TaxID=1936990 RepID=UPI00156315D2|nr:MBL fold metallo-hydrolase [Nitrospira sp. KM1]